MKANAACVQVQVRTLQSKWTVIIVLHITNQNDEWWMMNSYAIFMNVTLKKNKDIERCWWIKKQMFQETRKKQTKRTNVKKCILNINDKFTQISKWNPKWPMRNSGHRKVKVYKIWSDRHVVKRPLASVELGTKFENQIKLIKWQKKTYLLSSGLHIAGLASNVTSKYNPLWCSRRLRVRLRYGQRTSSAVGDGWCWNGWQRHRADHRYWSAHVLRRGHWLWRRLWSRCNGGVRVIATNGRVRHL